jgi:hypothetical protein
MLANAEIMTLMEELKPRFFEELTSSEIASIIAPATKRSFRVHSVMAHEGYATSIYFC